MLVLSRKLGEGVNVGDDIEIKVIEIKGSKIRLGVVADERMTILRAELYDGALQNCVEESQEQKDAA
ncbi:MAG: carbon storage regulator [Planctomycetia bacterium]|nr:carbon storage regulator [Planctomycetia bacterium]